MTAIALRYGTTPTTAGSSHAGVSGAAQRICDMLGDVARHWSVSATGQIRFAEPVLALSHIYQRCKVADWNSEDALPIPFAAILEAQELLALLPSSIPAAELMPESSGGIAFEWYRGHGQVYVISVSGTKSIEYAGLFGPGNETHGKTNFEGSLPVIIQEHLREFFS